MKKVQIKIPVKKNSTVDSEKLIPVFYEWIRNKKLNELLIDVVDYAHVKNGPGVVLIGHSSDYYFTDNDGQYGLLYSRKRDLEADDSTAIADALNRALQACAYLEEEPSLKGLEFSTEEIIVRINDRLNAPNDDSTTEILRPNIEKQFSKAFNVIPTIKRISLEGQLWSVQVSGAKGSVKEALERLSKL